MRFSDYARSIGLPVVPIGIGVGLMTANWFLTGSTLFYIGAFWLGYDAHAQVFKTKNLWRRLVGLTVYLVALGSVSYAWIFVPSPLEITVDSKLVAYGDGTTIYGIKWKSAYSQLDFLINNSGSADYENFTAKISTDLTIEQLSQTGGLGTCSISPESPLHAPVVQHFENGKPVGPAGVGEVDANGQHYEYTVRPRDRQGKIGPPMGTDTTFLIRCDRLTARSHVDFTAALSVVNPEFGPLYSDPKTVKWATVDATFVTSGRQRHLIFPECSNKSTCSINRRFDSELLNNIFSIL